MKKKLITISDLAHKLKLLDKKTGKPQTHTLRFWEKKFKQLKPTILAGGRRYYSVKDIEVVKIIFFLLKDQGLTINGAQKTMNENLKHLDGTKTLGIKADYYRKKIKYKSKRILNKIKKIKWQKKHILKLD